MKKRAMAGVLLLISGMVFAQHPQHKRDPKERAEKQTEAMKSVLDLSQEQYASVKKINERYAEKASEIRKDASAEKVDREQFRSLHQDRRKEINSVLTLEQQQKWETYRKERKEQRRAEHVERGAAYMKELKTSLSLSDDQINKLQDERLAFNNKAKSVRDEASLSPDAKKAKRKALRVEHEAVVKSILSTEQFEKWLSMKKDKKGHRHSGHHRK